MSVSKMYETSDWITTGEAAALAPHLATRQTFLKWAQEGYIDAIRSPGPRGRWKIRRAAVLAMLEPTHTTPSEDVPVGELVGQQELALGRVS